MAETKNRFKSPVCVTSEIGKLKTVILKRPGREIENITPTTMSRLLFDDIPYLRAAQKEHDYFAQILRANGTEVLYLNDLVVDSLKSLEVRQEFVEQMIQEAGIYSEIVHDALTEYLLGKQTKDMVDSVMVGVRKEELKLKKPSLSLLAEDIEHPFILDPMPSLYFTRDPAATIGQGFSINSMTYKARKRESLFMECVAHQNERFAAQKVQLWRDRKQDMPIEGGDQLVLNDHVMAIGLSQRTSADAIEDLAKNLFASSNFDTVITLKIPHNHAMMHLDTVFTMINSRCIQKFCGTDSSKCGSYIQVKMEKLHMNIELT